eukprot:TRINITY_DN7260_c0_g1_i1.p2 TRINITY_DN7260_c0_g1~~TRINITY_DN7260_c0_g1_i1.p2  ORF type:complete len:166 (-),score=25.38 TRINITY_DN7260_c0_g1_i1:153-650(-)
MGTFEPHCCLSHFCEHNGPQVEFIVQAAPAAHRSPTASVLDAVQYRTLHGQLVFEGSRHIHSAWTAFLRGTCIRCLSVEFLGGEAKTMCFGDHSQGYTSFYLFKIPDAQARGCSRQLCLSLTCPAPRRCWRTSRSWSSSSSPSPPPSRGARRPPSTASTDTRRRR